MPIPVRHRVRRVAFAAALPFLTVALGLTTAAPAFACSCAMPGPMSDYMGAENAVFSGIAGPLDARGVPVRVSTWYHGPNVAPLVYLAKGSFADEASCGTAPPPNGSSWIWVTYVDEGPGLRDFGTGLCSPSAQLGTPEGAAMVADAARTFGGGPPPGAETGPPEAVPAPPLSPDQAPLILAATLGLGVVVLGAVTLLALRRPRSAR
ncbi:MAG TPA: hypothetical protein VFV72_15095 [Candidatus Limnocylindrales bacterium]|nr:hypothetical protein [Candidatus Limnocylindrales bacterium]